MRTQFNLEHFPLTQSYVTEYAAIFEPLFNKHGIFLLRTIARYTERVKIGDLYGSAMWMQDGIDKRKSAWQEVMGSELTAANMVDVGLAEALYALVPMNQRSEIKPPLIEIR